MKYPSKISYGLLAFIAVVMIGSTLPLIFPPKWIVLIINLLVLLFIVHIFSTTYYLVDGRFLIVRSGFIVNKKIDINSVKSIKETNSMISAPALSFDRLEVNWGKFSGIVISPRDKHGFVAEMIRINPQIEVRWKDK